MSLWLTSEELAELTGYKSQLRQKRALGVLGVPFQSRPADGFPLVKRCEFEAHTVLQSDRKRREPRLELVR